MLAERLAAQLLSGPPAQGPVAVAERLLAVQAQDPRGARLAVRARTAGGVAGDVDRALSDDRTLVVDWLNRGTLHLVRREDHSWLHALTAPTTIAANVRRLAQEGVPPADAERGVAAVTTALAEEGPLPRGVLRDRVAAAGVRVAGQAFVHVLVRASLLGLVCRGPVAGREQAFALRRDWLGPPRPVNRDAALAELARRYLAGHGPAMDRDLARWAGLPLRDARAGLSAVGAELRPRPDGLLDLARRPGGTSPPLPPPRLLGTFEPLLLGWTSRDDVLAGHAELVTRNGIFRAFALVDGRAAATWTLRAGRVAVQPFAPLDAAAAAALEADGADVARYLSR